jgi:hypothetical protein
VNSNDKSTRGNASQFFIAGELCRRGLVASVTLGNSPNTDILCSNVEGTKFVHIQVKTYNPSRLGAIGTVAVGKKSEIDYGDNFFWVLGGIPDPDTDHPFCFYVIPSSVLAKEVSEDHALWLAGTKRDGSPRQDSSMRRILLPPARTRTGWSIAEYYGRWDLIVNALEHI